MPDEILQVGGAIALITLVIRELFAYLKSRGAVDGTMNENIFHELQRMNNNHLHTIQEKIEQGNKELIEVMHRDNIEMIKLLSEIKGGINAR